MNTIVTSKEQLLEAAKEIAKSQGISKISIRSIANACHVSIGSIYNYFPTKADLLAAVIEDFWISAFLKIEWEGIERKGFIHCFEQLFYSLSSYMKKFKESFLSQVSGLENSKKLSVRERELSYLKRVEDVFLKSLEWDCSIEDSLWNKTFTKEQFAAFAVSNMMVLLKNGQDDSSFLTELFKKTLYQQSSVI